METIKTFINLFKKHKPLVYLVGDCMIDEYFNIEANRISPEFPIAVMRSGHDRPQISVPGGAGNAVKQFVNFNADVKYFGFVDPQATKLLNNHHINTKFCVCLPEHAHVPVKKRLYNGDFPLCRWDIEEKYYGLVIEELKLVQQELHSLWSAAPNPEVAIFSDYDKGIFSGTPQEWFNKDTITIIDPKKGPLEKWRGCTVFKPNSKEAFELSGISGWQRQCDFFQAKLGCMAVVITDGAKGVMGKVGATPFEYRPENEVPAESVIGAGDCFVSFLALGLAYAMDLVEAVKVAYEAGRVYVQHKHNLPLTPYDLMRHVDPVEAKLVEADDLRIRNFSLAMTNGCFDMGLTENHIKSLRIAKSKADMLVVAINSDESVARLKGEGRPIMKLDERKRIVASLECVDFVVTNPYDFPVDLVKQIMPDCLVKGGDYKAEDVAGYGIVPIVIHPVFAGISTTDKIKKVFYGS